MRANTLSTLGRGPGGGGVLGDFTHTTPSGHFMVSLCACGRASIFSGLQDAFVIPCVLFLQ